MATGGYVVVPQKLAATLIADGANLVSIFVEAMTEFDRDQQGAIPGAGP